MELVLYTLNGFLIVGATRPRDLAVERRTSSRIGAIAVVTGLVLRIVAMSGWILWVVAGIFENIGVVQEGMETISRGQPGRRPAGQPSRSSCARARSASRTSASTTAARSDAGAARRGGVIHDLSLHDQARREGRAGRPLGRRQVDARQPAAALLRPGGGPHPDRRPGHRPRHAGQPARADRHGDAGHLAAAPLGARQHPLRPARCRRGGGDRGGPEGAGPRLHRRARGPEGPQGLSTPTSASAASSSPAASASASPSPACC